MPKDILSYKAYSLQEVMDMPTKAPLVEGLIYHHGKSVLVAKPKTGKTWLSLKIAMSLAEEQPMLGLSVDKASVLYLEFDRRNLKPAIQELSKGRQIEGIDIMPLPFIALNHEKGYQELLGIITEYMKGRDGELLVIIDHKSACFDGKESKDDPNRHWIGYLDKVALVYPVTYLVLCQAPKKWSGDTVDLPIGSRILTAWADTVISLQRNGRGFRKLEVVSNYDELEPIIYNKQFVVAPEQAVEETKCSRAIDLIRGRWADFLPGQIKKIVEKEITKEVGCSNKIAWNAYNEVKREMATAEFAAGL